MRKLNKSIGLAVAMAIIAGSFAPTMNVFAENTAKIEVERIGGANRTDTSLKILDRIGAKKIYLANGYQFADALSIAPIAAVKDYGIVLASKNNKSLEDNLLKKGIKETIFVGGENSLSKSMEKNFSSKFSTKRIFGKNRYKTSEQIVKSTGIKNVGVATGIDFPDALSSGPLLAKKNIPLLLIDGKKQNKLPDGLNGVYTFGGKSSVVHEFGKRISGSNRYKTSVKIAEEYGKSDVVILASGKNSADALAAAPLSKKMNAPLLLVDKNSIDKDAKSIVKKAKKVIVVGGSSSISDNLVNEIKGYTIENNGQIDKPNVTPGETQVKINSIKILGNHVTTENNMFKLSLTQGESEKLSAKVFDDKGKEILDSKLNKVEWSFKNTDGVDSNTSINSEGKLTIAESEKSKIITVVAKSVNNSKISAELEVTVVKKEVPTPEPEPAPVLKVNSVDVSFSSAEEYKSDDNVTVTAVINGENLTQDFADKLKLELSPSELVGLDESNVTVTDKKITITQEFFIEEMTEEGKITASINVNDKNYESSINVVPRVKIKEVKFVGEGITKEEDSYEATVVKGGKLKLEAQVFDEQGTLLDDEDGEVEFEISSEYDSETKIDEDNNLIISESEEEEALLVVAKSAKNPDIEAELLVTVTEPEPENPVVETVTVAFDGVAEAGKEIKAIFTVDGKNLNDDFVKRLDPIVTAEPNEGVVIGEKTVKSLNENKVVIERTISTNENIKKDVKVKAELIIEGKGNVQELTIKAKKIELKEPEVQLNQVTGGVYSSNNEWIDAVQKGNANVIFENSSGNNTKKLSKGTSSGSDVYFIEGGFFKCRLVGGNVGDFITVKVEGFKTVRLTIKYKGYSDRPKAITFSNIEIVNE